MRRLGTLAIAVLVMACAATGCSGQSIGSSSPEPSPTATAPVRTAPVEETPPPGVPSPWTPEIKPILVDKTGLATEITPVMPTTPFEEGLSVEDSDQAYLLVSWLGSPCEREPTLVLEGSADQLVVTVYRGPIEAGECPASQPHRTVRIGLTSGVDPASAAFELRDGSPSG